jgi:hypothetical protein
VSPQGFVEASTLRAFPCHHNKVPLTTRWQEAKINPRWDAWPLVGVATGAASGFDVLDIDLPEGVAWYDANFDALPTTRAHTTQRGGLHLLFRAAPGLRCSASRIAAGVDVRADGGYVIWWPREGLPIDDAPLCEWPEWLLREARGEARRSGLTDPNKKRPHPPHDADAVLVRSLIEGLWRLDPRKWREYGRWLGLMTACKAEGIDCAAWVEWSVQDERYADDGPIIERLWAGCRPEHGGALFAALAEAGIRLASHHTSQCTPHRQEGSSLIRVRSAQPPSPTTRSPTITPTRNFYARIASARAPLERARGAAREPALFAAGCILAKMIAEKRLPPDIAMRLLESDCQTNGLWKELGKERCRRTITRAFRHVEEKILSAT